MFKRKAVVVVAVEVASAFAAMKLVTWLVIAQQLRTQNMCHRLVVVKVVDASSVVRSAT